MSLPPDSCALANAGVDLAGTAPGVIDRWLLIEASGPWAPKILRGPGLPEQVAGRLLELQRAYPGFRVQLIRRGPPEPAGMLRCFLSTSDEDHPVLHSLLINRHEDLLDIDLESWITHDWQAARLNRPRAYLLLVCAHGRRDRCCGVRGAHLLGALAAQAATGVVWQTSHLGGHRFAATALALPWGHLYGRLAPEHAPGLLAALARHETFDPRHLRGRSTWSGPVQAADCYLRGTTMQRGAGAVSLLSCHDEAAGRWSVHLALCGQEHTLNVHRARTKITAPKSCGDAPEPAFNYVVTRACS